MLSSPLHRFYGPPNKPAIAVTPSKHARGPFKGRCLLAGNSNIRKLSHAWYRKLITTAEAQNAAVH